MKIILKEEVDNLGLAGDIVEVADGYGRNYLIPRGKAIIATPGAEKEAKALLRARKAREAATLDDAQAMKDTLESRTLRIEKRVDDRGHLYGSVGRGDIHDVLRQRGHDIQAKRIEFGKPIKEIGEYEVEVQVHPQVMATVTYEVVDVEGEVTLESLAAAAQAEEPGPPLLDEEGNLITEPEEEPDTTDVEALAQQALEAARQFEAEATGELSDDEDAADEAESGTEGDASDEEE
jgi:large subunit ribosomal protein L9